MKKIIVSSKDYELYRFFMPWKYLFAHEENRFILGELEKQHPRFSATCCFDTKYSLKKKQVLAEVVVMEKSSLARYKTGGGELFIEENKKRSVFSSRTKIFRTLTLILIILSGILSFRIAKTVFSERENTASEQTENPLIEDEAVEEEKLPSAQKLIDEIFSSVSLRAGKVSSFSFSDGGKCKISIYGCHSEDIANAKYSVVSFKDNEPYFDLELPFEAERSKKACLSEGPVNESGEIARVRKELKKLGSKIEMERNSENEAEFSFSVGRSVLYSALKICSEATISLGFSEKKFSVSQAKGNCQVNVLLKKGEKSDFSVMASVAKYAYLFGKEEQKIVAKQSRLFELNTSRTLLNSIDSEIGKIRRDDGTVLICFRNKDGKTELKEAVNEN